MAAEPSSSLVRLHLTVLPARPADGRVDAAPVRRRGHVAPVRPAPGVPAGGHPARAAAPRATATAIHERLRAVRGSTGSTTTRRPTSSRTRRARSGDRARARARAARAVARPADGRLLGERREHRRPRRAAALAAEVGLDATTSTSARGRRVPRARAGVDGAGAVDRRHAVCRPSCSTAGCSCSARSRARSSSRRSRSSPND